MTAQPVILAIDVCLGQCAAAVVSGDEILADLSEPMERGHAERLADMVREALSAAGAVPANLTHLAATCGPGSFTGARLGVAFVRGMALPLNAKTVGISSFDALAELAPAGNTLCVLDGRRNELFVQPFQGGVPQSDPQAVALEAEPLKALLARTAPDTLIGGGAALLLEATGQHISTIDAAPSAALVARAAQRSIASGSAQRAKPFYLRAPDAKPSTKALV